MNTPSLKGDEKAPKVEHDDPNGYSRPIYDVHVSPDRNRLPLPVEFLEPGTLYELELLALEKSGNQTITVGFFWTEDAYDSSLTSMIVFTT